MSKNTIVTIGRQYGSGGRWIGQKLAREMGVPFYDNELLILAAKESGMSKELFEAADETAASGFSHAIAGSSYLFGSRLSPLYDLPINDKLFILQSNVIHELAQKSSCVIVGRCADYVLEEDEAAQCVNVFIHASMAARRKRAVEIFGIDPAKVEDVLIKTDKRRANYYNYYTCRKWGLAENYHLALDSGAVGTDNAVRVILEYVRSLGGQEKD